jgi:hypothetical protein
MALIFLIMAFVLILFFCARPSSTGFYAGAIGQQAKPVRAYRFGFDRALSGSCGSSLDISQAAGEFCYREH